MVTIKKSLMDEIICRYGAVRANLPKIFRRPIGFFFYITGRCNLRCSFCWQREDGKKEDSWLNSSIDELTEDEWVRLVSSLPRRSFLGISGGESTSSHALARIVRTANQRIPITINTNGAAWREEHFDLLTDPGVKNVSISLDGFAEVHDWGRGLNGLFKRIVDNIDRLNQIRLRNDKPALTIKTVLMDENVDTLLDFRRFCEEKLKADTLNISFMKVGNHAQFSLRYCSEMDELFSGSRSALYDYRDPEKISEILSKMLEDNKTNRCKVVLYPRMKSSAEIHSFLSMGGKGVYRPCYLPWAMVVVLPNGEVIPCLSLSLGNVKDYQYDIKRLLKNKNYEAFCKKINSFGEHLPHTCNVCCFLRVKAR